MTQTDEYRKYIRSAQWRRIADTMKRCAKNTCQRCGRTLHPGELDVHHLNYERLGRERPSDLQVLCRERCHPIADALRIECVETKRATRQTEAAKSTYLSKRYGENWESFADEGMHDEFDRWRRRKIYGETGEFS